MENQDHKATILSGHVSHGVHLCHKCGWPFPKLHPSARHRRAHKKVCGTIEGYKLTQHEATTNLAISDEEHLSDEGRTPSPKIDNNSLKEPAGSFKSYRSEDEVFSDAMTEFSDSGLNPGIDEGLEAARKLVKDGDELLKADATTDACEARDDPSRGIQTGDDQLLGCEMNSFDATPFGSKSEEDTSRLDEKIDQQLDPMKFKTLVAPIVENDKESVDNALMRDDRQDICVKEEEHANVSEILTEVEEKGDVHLLSVAKDVSCLHNVEFVSQDYKDYSSLKSSLALDLGATNEPISPTQDDVDASEDDIRKDDGKVLVEGKVGGDGSELINDENFGSYGASVSSPATLESPILSMEPINSLSMEDESSQNHFQQCSPIALSDKIVIVPSVREEVRQTTPTILVASGDDVKNDDHKVTVNAENFESCGAGPASVTLGSPILEPTNNLLMENESSQDSFQQCKPLGCSDNNPIAPCTGEEIRQAIISGGSERFYDCVMDKTRMSFTAENESTEWHLLDQCSANTKIGFEETQSPDSEKSETKCFDVASYWSMEETEGKVVKITGGGAEDYQAVVPNIAWSEHKEEDAKDNMVNIEPMHNSSSMEVVESPSEPEIDERKSVNEDQISPISREHEEESSLRKCNTGPTFSESANSPVDMDLGNTISLGNNDIVDATSTSGVGPLALKDEGDEKTTKQQDGVSAVDTSFASSGRTDTDSLEANWGSVSVSIQSESTAPIDGAPEKSSLEKTKIESNSDDTFEPPSFMTLVEPRSTGIDQKAALEIDNMHNNAQHPSEPLKAGWFPSLSNVVNETEGRKKNEEIIAKVTKWSTTGKQHMPLKNLLGDAKSPNTKQVPMLMQKDETAASSKVTTVNSILSSFEKTPSGNKEVGKEWNSPARYPVDIKKEKKKGKGYWVPFACCSSSVH